MCFFMSGRGAREELPMRGSGGGYGAWSVSALEGTGTKENPADVNEAGGGDAGSVTVAAAACQR